MRNRGTEEHRDRGAAQEYLLAPAELTFEEKFTGDLKQTATELANVYGSLPPTLLESRREELQSMFKVCELEGCNQRFQELQAAPEPSEASDATVRHQLAFRDQLLQLLEIHEVELAQGAPANRPGRNIDPRGLDRLHGLTEDQAQERLAESASPELAVLVHQSVERHLNADEQSMSCHRRLLDEVANPNAHREFTDELSQIRDSRLSESRTALQSAALAHDLLSLVEGEPPPAA